MSFLIRPRVASFPDIIQIAIIALKTTFKDSKKNLKNQKKLCIKTQSISVFLDPFQVKYNCAKFYFYRIYVTDFRKSDFLPPPHYQVPPPPPHHLSHKVEFSQ